MEQLFLLLCSVLFVVGSVTAETCPGGRVRCPTHMTCCQLSNDDFGCCPYPDAKCCSDRIHCCPESMDCDISHQSCIRNGSSVQFHWRVPIHAEAVEPVVAETTLTHQERKVTVQQAVGNESRCPDETKCHSSFTCCKMYSGKYGCCPLENGTCCQDGFHCCPHGSKCSASGECYSSELKYTVNAYPLKDKKHDEVFMAQTKLQKPAHQDVSDPGGKCPDGHPCPVKYTCCKISGKRYGCCPYTEARCCDDGIHCCPKGTNCNITLGTCDIQKNVGWSIPSQSLMSLEWSDAPKAPEAEEVQKHVQELVVDDVVCPDERVRCPSKTTCCLLASGTYGCCLMESATCCSDKEHCCPYGFACITGGCVKGSRHLPPFLRTAAAAARVPQETQVNSREVLEVTDVDEDVSDVVCPDHYACPDHNTCCQLESGEYGCCPMDQATCCPDKIHCCPHGYGCVPDGCRKNSGASWSLPLFLSAITVNRKSKTQEIHPEAPGGIEDILCPDTTECPDGSTCCEMDGGTYGCCPLEDATCCGDKTHCCPHGYWCSDEGCDRMPGMPWQPPFLQKLTGGKKLTGNNHGNNIQ